MRYNWFFFRYQLFPIVRLEADGGEITIGEKVFMESARLNQIEFLNGAVDIGTSAFEKCYKEEIVFSDTLTSVSIGGSAFSMFAWGGSLGGYIF